VLVVHPQCTHLRKEGNLGTDGTDETRELGDNGRECCNGQDVPGNKRP
jgi:hypothetical protein